MGEVSKLKQPDPLPRWRVEELIHYLTEAQNDPNQPMNKTHPILADHIRAMKELLTVKRAIAMAYKEGKIHELDRIHTIIPVDSDEVLMARFVGGEDLIKGE